MLYCGVSTASEVFLIFTTQLYQYFSVFFRFDVFSNEPEVFLPKDSQTAILHAAYFLCVIIYDKLLQAFLTEDIFILAYCQSVTVDLFLTPYTVCFSLMDVHLFR